MKRSIRLETRRHTALLVAAALAAALPATAKQPETEEEKTLYYLGVMAGSSLTRFQLTEAEIEFVKSGIADVATGKALDLDRRKYGQAAQLLMKTRVEQSTAAAKEASRKFLAEEANKPGVRKLDSGLLVEELVAGTGRSPTADDTVEVHYHGTLTDGTIFDSSVDRGQPFKTALARVVRCWQEGVVTMSVGGKSRLVCPAELGYGDAGAPPRIPGGAALVFEIELISIVE